MSDHSKRELPLRIVDRASAIDAINRLNEDDLRLLNRLIVERIKFISQTRVASLMAGFTKGDRVVFCAPDGSNLEGIVLRLNKKTVSVIASDGHQWNVSPGLLHLAE